MLLINTALTSHGRKVVAERIFGLQGAIISQKVSTLASLKSLHLPAMRINSKAGNKALPIMPSKRRHVVSAAVRCKKKKGIIFVKYFFWRISGTAGHLDGFEGGRKVARM